MDYEGQLSAPSAPCVMLGVLAPDSYAKYRFEKDSNTTPSGYKLDNLPLVHYSQPLADRRKRRCIPMVADDEERQGSNAQQVPQVVAASSPVTHRMLISLGDGDRGPWDYEDIMLDDTLASLRAALGLSNCDASSCDTSSLLIMEQILSELKERLPKARSEPIQLMRYRYFRRMALRAVMKSAFGATSEDFDAPADNLADYPPNLSPADAMKLRVEELPVATIHIRSPTPMFGFFPAKQVVVNTAAVQLFGYNTMSDMVQCITSDRLVWWLEHMVLEDFTNAREQYINLLSADPREEYVLQYPTRMVFNDVVLSLQTTFKYSFYPDGSIKAVTIMCVPRDLPPAMLFIKQVQQQQQDSPVAVAAQLITASDLMNQAEQCAIADNVALFASTPASWPAEESPLHHHSSPRSAQSEPVDRANILDFSRSKRSREDNEPMVLMPAATTPQQPMSDTDPMWAADALQQLQEALQTVETLPLDPFLGVLPADSDSLDFQTQLSDVDVFQQLHEMFGANASLSAASAQHGNVSSSPAIPWPAELFLAAACGEDEAVIESGVALFDCVPAPLFEMPAYLA
eukprot:TRINITY_DN13403_c0_g1_i1.p1 TRINITY_DN13403_c0_g1~~TRINITY_DN13403_c0_g1_i1.p1  ORF type:complete len:573 (-),score=124.18 TRINITY_DN13403_c0_g1_i1:203-1921(-)